VILKLKNFGPKRRINKQGSVINIDLNGTHTGSWHSEHLRATIGLKVSFRKKLNVFSPQYGQLNLLTKSPCAYNELAE
jgi:hypothetical protein